MSRRWLSSLASTALVISLSGCSLLGLGFGGAYAQSQNSDPRVERGEVGKSMALGGLIGLGVDAAIFALAVSSSSGPGAL